MHLCRAINLHEELIRLQEHQSLLIEEEIYISDIADHLVDEKLNELVDFLQADPETLITSQNLNGAKSFLKYMKDLTNENRSKFADIILSGKENVNIYIMPISSTPNLKREKAFNVFLVRLNEEVQNGETGSYALYRQILEAYLFLWYCLMNEIEKLWKDKRSGKALNLSQKKKKDNIKGSRYVIASGYDWTHTRLMSTKLAIKLVSSNIKPLYTHQSDLDTVINLALKTTLSITDDPEALKSEALQNTIIDMLVICSIKHSKLLGNSIEFKIIHDYLREESTVDFCVNFIKKLCEASENGKYTLENILKTISETPINTDDTPIVKALSKFLLKISINSSKEVVKQMVHLQSLLYSESYTIRSTVTEVMGNIIYYSLNTAPQNDSFQSVESYYQIFKERYRDISSNVRVKVIQTIYKLAERRKNNSSSSYIPLNIRPQFLELTIGRLLDKSTNVRRNAIRLLSKFVEVSPFILQRDKGSLSYELLSNRKEQLSRLINAKFNDILAKTADDPTPQKIQDYKSSPDLDNMDIDDGRVVGDESVPGVVYDNEKVFNSAKINRIRLLYIYYTDAIAFVESIAGTLNTMLQLMSSNYKGEAVEAMKFFVTCHNRDMEFASIGIKKMVHKIWDKDTGESGRMSVRDTLIKCYTGLYLQNEGMPIVPMATANNLVNCTLNMSLSEHTSLEQLLYSINSSHITASIVNSLWSIFNSQDESAPRKLGSIIVLGSLARADPSIITENINYLLKAFTQSQFSNNMLLPRYICYSISQLKNASASDCQVLKENELSEQLVYSIINFILEPNNNKDWFSCAEQAISAVYILSKSPSKLCSEIIRILATRCFFSPTNGTDSPSNLDVDKRINSSLEHPSKLSSETSKLDLSKLFFVVGHVASKQLVFLEDMEQEWKQNRNIETSKLQQAAKSNGRNATEDVDALMVTEEEITAYMREIKECELLGGKTSLLGLFANMISFVCANNATFNDPVLLNVSVISLSKLMCVSPALCESKITLLLSILESSRDPIVRNNIIIGLGDLTMCFNSILDKYMNRLYDRLDDPDPSVRKCTLTLLSFLTLNGMIRIRGQISTMVKCLSDADSSVRNVARLFFSEFSSKDNSIYVNLVDIISNLSDNKSGISEERFQEIFKIILEFVKKEKFTETLIEKLCQRLKNSELMCQCRNLSFCLGTLIQNSDRCMKKFMDCLPYYSNKLGDPAICSRFLEVSAKQKKSATVELKQSIETFENVLKEFHNKYATEFISMTESENTKLKVENVGHVNDNSMDNGEFLEDEEDIVDVNAIVDNNVPIPNDIPRSGYIVKANGTVQREVFVMGDADTDDMTTDDIANYDEPDITIQSVSFQESGDDMEIVTED